MKPKILLLTLLFSFSVFYPIVTQAQYLTFVNDFSIKYDITTVMIPMRDGIHLATDIYTPSSFLSGTRSIVLIRTPYGKSGVSSAASIFTSLQGYITVIQDMRGRFASEGIDMVFQNASTDGFDTIKWILQQSWCNGKIATYGMSALGINQFFMNLAHPEGLVAQAIQIASPNLYHDVMFPGGAFRQALVAGWLESIGSTFWLPIIYENENFGNFWKNVTMDGKYNTVTRPGLFQAGWFDVFSQGTIDGFLGYQYESDPSVQGKSFLIIGPWGHGTYYEQKHGDITFPANAVVDYHSSLLLDFFDYYLDKPDSLYQTNAVKYYCMGPVYEGAYGNFWRSTNAWPVPVECTNFYLQANGSITTNSPIVADESLDYLYDPKNPVPTIGGCNLVLPYGPRDQASLESRDDILIFTSETFAEYMEVTGKMSAHLWVSSNCTDTDFTVKITDVYPDGRSILLQDGIVRAKYRNNFTTPELLIPNEIVEVDIDLWSTSYIFNPGHKLRIAISSSNYPRFNANPNNGAPIFTNNETLIAKNTIYLDQNHPSYVTLPINVNATVYTQTPTNSTNNGSALNWIEIFSIELFIAISFIAVKKGKILKRKERM
ncbi:MAG: CocE/NonD family hydrolase [Candidatus Heimdallarchaeota archaeon]|nr:CocE/NonD family hydrolase [Candidatus Heimdallarchaeota archaeon]